MSNKKEKLEAEVLKSSNNDCKERKKEDKVEENKKEVKASVALLEKVEEEK